MVDPKLHHYVPQFHMRRFADAEGKVWVWDKSYDRTFQTSPGSIAAERQFYRLTDFEESGHDPLTMEKQLSDLEGQVSLITNQWLGWLRDSPSPTKIEIPTQNRDIFGLFLAVQYLRTLETRQILVAIAELNGATLTPDDHRQLHTTLMWDEDTVNNLSSYFTQATWIFAHNKSGQPFITSDNPIAFRTSDNRRWVKTGISTSAGVYAVYPMAPDIMLYCYPAPAPFDKLRRFDNSLSPVEFNDAMARDENTGQVFMATRFIISKVADFDAVRDFAPSIGTDRFKMPGD